MESKIVAGRTESKSQNGLLYGFTAYLIWGLVPVYWPHLQPATPIEILCHRIIWSLLFLLVIGARKYSQVITTLRDRQKVKLLAVASILISVNWGLFIWASITKQLLDSSLGYFITPLLSVAIGVAIFKEQLRSIQWIAVGIAGMSVVYLTVVYGKPPWLALALAFSFGLYGYVKKLAKVPALESLTVETIFLAPFALGYLSWLEISGAGTFGHAGLSHGLWLASSGVVTAVPLMLFTAAAIRVPLTTMGMLQYLGPTLQYFIGIRVFHESMSSSRLLGFALSWVAIAIFSFDALNNRRTTLN